MGKKDKKASRYADDDWENEIGETLPAKEEPQDEAAPDEAATGPQDLLSGDGAGAIEDDDDEFAMPTKAGKKGKKGGAKKAEQRPDSDDEAEVAVPEPQEFRVKTKKEKERERKEREKAAKKKGGAAKPKSRPQEAKEDRDGDDTAVDSLGESLEASSLDTAKPAGGKNKKLSALQKMVEKQRQLEEERRRQEEEERKRIAEEEARAAEEERLKEEARLRKKEKERQKKEELKAQGKYLTKKQRQEQAASEARKQQMLASGIINVAGLSRSSNAGDSRRSGSRRPRQEASASPSPAPASPAPEKAEEAFDGKAGASEATSKESETAAEEEAGEEEDDWEALDAQANIDEKAKESDGDEIADSWENFEDEEPAKAEPAPATKPKSTSQKAEVVSGKAKAEKKPAATNGQHKDESVDSVPEAGATPNTVSKENLRSPICCIMGHVDTGKTKLLDNIRKTNVQEGEAGGITQQIGATYFPMENIERRIEVVNKDHAMEFKLPGLLVIDTPGHESFANLRSRGSSLCNIAILVIDIMHGLEPQTLESIKLLRDKKTPFIVALNKIDRLYGWQATKDGAFQESLAKQKKSVQREFADRLDKTKLALAEQGLNSEVFYNNKQEGRYVSLVPTSAVTGEGVPDMLKLLINLTQKRMSNKLMYLSELQCTVLEVKVIEGLGTTIDVVLSNGILHEGDKIVVCGLGGPIVTHIRALLTPQPMKEMRIKSPYVHHKEMKAAMGIKIAANDLEKAVAGSRLLVCGPDDDEEALKEDIMEDLEDLLNSVDKSGVGVYVQASTLGALEALLDFLKQMNIPVSGINIGPVFKRDVMRCATMLEKAKEFALMLCFDVKIDREAEELAEQLGVKIFSANIIYHLFDAFKAHQEKMLEQKRQDSQDTAVFPCVLKTIASFNKKDPIILGVDVIEGVLRSGTPICALRPALPGGSGPQIIDLGRVVSIESNHKSVDKVKKGQAGGGVAIKLEGPDQILYGRQVDDSDLLYSRISRASINTLKDPAFRNDVSKEEWQLIVQLKAKFGIA